MRSKRAVPLVALVVAVTGCSPSGSRGRSAPGEAPAPGAPASFSPEALAVMSPAPPPPTGAESQAPPSTMPPPAPPAPPGPAPTSIEEIRAAFAEQNASTLAPIATPATAAMIASARLASGPDRGLIIEGRIQRLWRNEPGVINTGGFIVVGDKTVVIPKNLIIDFTVVRLTLEEIFQMAPEPYRSKGLSGLALEDGGAANDWTATILANKVGDVVIAGKIDIAKRVQVVSGIVSAIDFATGELRLDGDAAGTVGTRVRISDPEGVFSVQSASLATGPGFNGCPDLRIQTDAENAMFTAATGYPMRIPTVDPAFGDDPRCPRRNRNQAIDSALGGPETFFAAAPTLQAPLLVGDHVVASGSFEIDPGPDQLVGTSDDVRFLSADTVDVIAWIFTQPLDPCYVKVHEAQWIGPPFPLRRVDLLVVGFCTDLTTQIDVNVIRRDPTNAAEHFELVGTANVLPFGKFEQKFSQTLGGGGGQVALAPGTDLITMARDLRAVARNQNSVDPNAPFLNRGGFTSPIGIVYPAPEINRRFLGEAFEFKNTPWLVDGDGTPRAAGALDPWPGLETRPNDRVLTVRNGQLVTRASVGLPSTPGDLSR